MITIHAAQRRVVLACLIVLGAPAQAFGQGRNVTGVVRDSVNGESLPSANLLVVGTQIRARTDAYGRFALLGIPPGPHTVEVKRLSYAPKRVALPDSAIRTLTVLLAPLITSLETMTVSAAPDLMKGGEQPSVVEISPSQLGTLPSVGETDVFRALQLLPGVSGTSDASSGLSVRGGTGDENLVLLDGMTVYHVDHFFGFFSAFNTDAIKDVRLMKGGYGAKYGGRTSSVLDIVGKSGNNEHFDASAGASLLSLRTGTEVPLGGKGSWLLSLRRSYTDVIRSGLYNRIAGVVGGDRNRPADRTGGSITSCQPSPCPSIPQASAVPDFYFYDVNSKVSLVPTTSDVVTFSVYASQDNLDLSNSGGGGPTGVGPAVPGGPSVSALSNTAKWGNTGVSGRWSRNWGARFTSDLLGAYSEYYSRGNRSTGSEDLAFGFDEDNRVRDMHVRLDNEWKPFSVSSLGFGAELTRNRVSYVYQQLAGDSVRGLLNLGSTGVLSAAYSQLRLTPSKHLDLTVGLRETAYDRTRKTYVEPRASAEVLLTDHWKLKGAWGRYNQFVKRVENENIQLGSRDFWVLAGDTMPVAHAEHRIVGGSYENDDYVFDVEAYRKLLDGVSQFSTRARTQPDEAPSGLFFSGTGEARGIEWLVQKKRGRLTGWTSYTLAKAEYTLNGFNSGKTFPASQDQRHEFKTVGAYQLGRWVLASTWIYGSGKPYTIPESQYAITTLDGDTVTLLHVGAKNSVRLPAYHRLDISGSRHFESDRFTYDLNLSVFNVYARKNVWYRSFDLTQTPLVVTDVSTLGFTPSIGLSVGLRK